nr:MAG TPA: hypothetical protein [Caudoviricetes sp.]
MLILLSGQFVDFLIQILLTDGYRRYDANPDAKAGNNLRGFPESNIHYTPAPKTQP